MGFFRQEYWSGLPCPPPGDLPEPGIKPASLMSPALAGRFLSLVPPGKPREQGCTDNWNGHPDQLLRISRWDPDQSVFKTPQVTSVCKHIWKPLLVIFHLCQALANHNLEAKSDCFCARAKNGYYIFQWLEKKNYFTTCEKYMKLKFQCPYIIFYWNTAMSIPSHMSTAVLKYSHRVKYWWLWLSF